jgi:hypothetical protein
LSSRSDWEGRAGEADRRGVISGRVPELWLFVADAKKEAKVGPCEVAKYLDVRDRIDFVAVKKWGKEVVQHGFRCTIEMGSAKES